MKKLLPMLLFMVASFTAFSQTEVKASSDGFLVKVEKPKVEIPTPYKFMVKDVEYPVYKTDKDKYFVTLYSEKTQKKYRRYLKLMN